MLVVALAWGLAGELSWSQALGPGPGPALEGWGEMAPRTEDCTDYGAFGRTPWGIWTFLSLLEKLGAARGGGEGKGVRGRWGKVWGSWVGSWRDVCEACFVMAQDAGNLLMSHAIMDD